MHNKSLVELGELRTMMEELRWDNMRKSVGECRDRQFLPWD